MPITQARRAVYLQELLRFLSERQSARQEEVVAHLAAVLHPSDEERSLHASYGEPDWEVRMKWDSSVFTGVDWMTKDGWGTWSITPSGVEALAKYSDPDDLWAEANVRYRRMLAERKSRRRAWLVRGSSVSGVDVVRRDWLRSGFCSLPASQLRPIEPDVGDTELRRIVGEDYGHLKAHELRDKLEEILAFVKRMHTGDVVLTTSEDNVYVGDVTGHWSYAASHDTRTNLRRPVAWRNGDRPIATGDLPAPLPSRLQTGQTLVELTEDIDLIDGLTASPREGALATADTSSSAPHVVDGEVADEPVRRRHEHLEDPSPELASELFVDQDWLQEVRNVLDERRQLVFYGPPGTGKTYIARALATDLVGLEQVKLVQFHPAYTYEDFFEGFRPVLVKAGDGAGTVGFEIHEGPLRRLVRRARDEPDKGFVLIIDEINRADLAKVFGELYFLLEYRDQAVDLLYSPDDQSFTLPSNLYIIGTMNTADRSIALVDDAMRRRFAFVSLHPDETPVRSLLRRWSEHHELGDRAARLLDELNSRIDDPNFRIGPAYFMKQHDSDAHCDERLDRIWRTAIMPLLEEHHYGNWRDVRHRYELASLLEAVEA